MNTPMRVLLVQRHQDQGRLRHWLQRESAMDFEWRRLFSENELRIAASEYAPSVVVCADDMQSGSPRATLAMLTMFAKQAPQLMVCEVCEDSAPWNSAAADMTGPWRRPVFEPAEMPNGTAVMPDGRPQLPAILRSSLDAVLMLDENGWVTDINPRAQRLLGIGVRQRPRAQAHVQDLILALRAAGEGRCTSLPLVALNLDGLLLLNAQSGEQFGDAALDLIASVVQPQFARCGLLARIGVHQFLAMVPHMSPAADAAAAVGGVRRAHAERNLSTLHAITSRNDAEVKKPPARLRNVVPNIAADLSAAIERHALDVHFQPQYELTSGQGCGAEALARWPLASGQSVSPCRFIPIAERNGCIGALDAWVLKMACTTALRWRGAGADCFNLAVNVSDRQFGAEYLRTLSEVLSTCRFPAHRLELELGEDTISSHSPTVKACLRQCKLLGVRLAVSHHSGNYSALKYLSRTVVDRLKLDKAIIQRITLDQSTASSVQATIALCAALKIDVIAEGVETSAQLAMLRDFGCPQAQGFLLARPMPSAQAQMVLQKKWGNLLPAVAEPRMAVAH